MRYKLLLILFLLSFSFCVKAQNQCDEIIQKIKVLLNEDSRSKDYEKILNNLLYAQEICKSAKKSEIDEMLKLTFQLIENEKNNSIRAQKEINETLLLAEERLRNIQVSNLIDDSKSTFADKTIAFHLLKKAYRTDPKNKEVFSELFSVAYDEDRPWRINPENLSDSLIQSFFVKQENELWESFINGEFNCEIIIRHKERKDTVFIIKDQSISDCQFKYITVSKYGDKVAYVSNNEFYPFNGTIKVWDIVTSSKVLDQRTIGYISDIGFSANGDLLAVKRDDDIIIWDFKLHGNLIKFSDDSHAVPALENYHFVDFNPQTLLSTYISDTKIVIMDRYRKVKSVPIPFNTEHYILKKATVSTNEDFILVAYNYRQGRGDSRTIALYDLKKGEYVFDCLVSRGGMHSLAFSPDNSSFMYAGWNLNVMNLIDSIKKIEVSPIGNGIFDAAEYSHDGTMIAAGGRQGELNLIKLNNTEENKVITVFSEAFEWISSVTFSHDSKFIAVGSINGHVLILDAKSGKVEYDFSAYEMDSPSINKMAFSPKDNLFVTVSGYDFSSHRSTNFIQIWDITNGSELISFYSGNYSFLNNQIDAIFFLEETPSILYANTKGRIEEFVLDPSLLINKIESHHNIGDLTETEKAYFDLVDY